MLDYLLDYCRREKESSEEWVQGLLETDSILGEGTTETIEVEE